MGMLLGIKTETFTPAENQSWLGSAHGTQEMDSVTLDGDRFLAAFPTGIVPSGVVLARDLTSGLGVPYNPAYDSDTVAAGVQPNGADVAIGHLFTTTDLGGTTAATVGNTPASLYWHGEVVESKLPAGHGLDAAAKTKLAQIRYV